MRSLPAAITAALHSSGAAPAMQVTIEAPATPYVTFASGGAAGRCASLLLASGALLRATVPQGAGPQTISVNRIADPGNAAQWTAGTPVAPGVQAGAGCCLAQTGATIRLFYCRASDSAICYRDSEDDGTSWGAEAVVQPAFLGYARCYGIMADGITTVWAQYAGADAAPCVMPRSGWNGRWSAWSNEGPDAPEGWGRLRGACGVAAAGTFAFLMGVETRAGMTGISPCTSTWNGSAYTGFNALRPLDNADLGLSYPYSTLSYDGALYWACITLCDDGSVSGAPQSRTTILTSRDLITWTALATLASFPYGCAAITACGVTYLCDGETCLTLGTAPAPLDVSDAVISLAVTEQGNAPAQAVISLFNGDGRFAAAAWSGAPVTIAFGYNGSMVATHRLWADTVSWDDSAQGATVTLTCRDALRCPALARLCAAAPPRVQQ